MAFVPFALRYATRADPTGDLARDMKADRELNRRWGFPRVYEYLVRRGASDDAVAALRTIERDYRYEQYVLRAWERSPGEAAPRDVPAAWLPA